MQTIIIPLIVLMLVSLLLYTISVFNIHAKGKVTRMNIGFIHPSIILFIIGLFYMSGVSNKLHYHNVSYAMMNVHQGVGYLALLILIVHAIWQTILKRRGPLSSKSKAINIILWIIYIILFIIALYIGIKAGLN